ncbi:beta-ketoacyl synthase N-terminal-like domain-containing protein [Streptomyces albus]|uniref:beta-ketoacyl synthase N-terminal-like domain-containing protein n=1 Tax=Streptomyces albus TaxID=1888 RepID=UPI0004CB643F|nr:beta-ketoacyl synthase N-terminal-like domain-containing protein [Streptomyces albus]
MPEDLVITGCGVVTAVGTGKQEFTTALFSGAGNFGVMARPGRSGEHDFLGAEIAEPALPERFPKKLLRTVSLSGKAALLALHEAWEEARLERADPERVGLVVGGSNIQQRELVLKQEAYRGRSAYLPPTYAFSYLDSDLCGLCSEQFGIQGMAHTVGGASASGQMAVIQAAQAVRSGAVDVCVAIGALADLSAWECQALRSIGAMGSDRFADQPELACRPFDASSDGFIYGEACGAVVVERASAGAGRGARPYAALTGWGVALDANRNPDPSVGGESRAIRQALAQAGRRPGDIDYVNPHGTGSGVGDPVELTALRSCGLDGAYLNATKSITGHGLSAAGTVEIIATLLQMEAATLHPTRNLETPIDPAWNWVRERSVLQPVTHALTLSMGFGGVNTALCLQNANG